MYNLYILQNMGWGMAAGEIIKLTVQEWEWPSARVQCMYACMYRRKNEKGGREKGCQRERERRRE